MRNALLLLFLAALLGAGAWFVLDTPSAGRAMAAGSGAAASGVEPSAAATTDANERRTGSATSSSHGAVSSAVAPLGPGIRSGVSLGAGLGTQEASAPRTLVAGGPTAAGREPIEFVGRISSNTNQPIAEASVTLRAGQDLVTVTSDTQGRFETVWFRGLPADLLVGHDEFVDLRAAAVDVEEYGPEAEFRLVPSGSIRGLVATPPGVSPEGFEVEVWWVASKSEKTWPRWSVEVAADGAFFVPDLEPGQYALCPRAPGLSGRYTAGHEVTSGSESFVELKCVDGALIEGQLVGPPGLSMPSFEGARIELVPRDVGLPKTLARERSLETAVDGSGDFRLTGVAPGAHRLLVEPPWGGVVSFPIDFDGSGERIEREFQVPPPAGLEGLVTDAAGRPVTAASVLVTRRKDKGSLVDALTHMGTPSETSELEIRTDARGRFRFETVAAGEPLVLVARLGQGPPAWSAVEALGAGEQRMGLVLALPEAFELRGRVEARSATGAVGEHLAGAKIQARYQSDGREFTFVSTVTDDEGQYHLEGLIPGPLRLEAQADGYIEASETVELVVGVAPPAVDLALDRALQLSGRVVDESGAGVGGLRILASVVDPDLRKLDPPGKRTAGPADGPPDRATRSDEYGRFQFSSLAVADWYLKPLGAEYELVEAEPRRADASFVEAGGSAELIVRRRSKSARAALALVVVRSDTGLAPAGIAVFGAGAASISIDGGDVNLTAMAPVPTRLILSAEGCASRYLDVELFPGAKEQLGIVELDPGARVTVEVLTPGGEPVTKAKVRLIPQQPVNGGPVAGTPTLSLEPIGGGRYRIEGVPLATWELKVTAKNAKTWRAKLTVDGEKEHKRVNLEAKGPGAAK